MQTVEAGWHCKTVFVYTVIRYRIPPQNGRRQSGETRHCNVAGQEGTVEKHLAGRQALRTFMGRLILHGSTNMRTEYISLLR